jgi:hypothetical protein
MYNDYIDPTDVFFITERNNGSFGPACRKCYEKSKGLIKDGNHYVPWNYHNNAERHGDEPGNPEFYEDVRASLPSVSWSAQHEKFVLIFDSPDLGGYDVTTLKWYYDSLEDLMEDMGLSKDEREIKVG